MNPLPEALADHAIKYAAKGYEVFPLRPDKVPYTANGMKDATSDIVAVEQMWRQHPEALIGCRVPIDGLLFDIDPRHGGHKTWQALQDYHNEIVPGRRHHSGRNDGGHHDWFIKPAGRVSIKGVTQWAIEQGVATEIVTDKGTKLTCGIDLLHNAWRYTILPPSLHKDTGQPYEWDIEGEPTEVPAWLAQLLEPPPAPPRPVVTRNTSSADSPADWFTETMLWADVLKGWTLVHSDGEADGSLWRHPTATAAHSASVMHGMLFVYSANTMLNETEEGDPAGHTKFKAWSMLEHDGDMSASARIARELRDGPPIDPPQVYVMPIHDDDPDNGCADATDTPIEWPELIPLGEARDRPEFPAHVFPQWAQQQVSQVATEMQMAPDLPAQSLITALSIIHAKRLRIRIDGPWVEKANTYLVTAMGSSDGKSPAMDKMIDPISDIQTEMIEAAAQQIADVGIRRKIIEKQQASFINKGETAAALALNQDLQELPELKPPRLIVDDCTPERVGEMLSEQGGRLAIVSTEAGLFDMMAGGYKDSSDLDVYLKGWSGDTYSADRMSRTTGVVKNAAITIGLTVQPSVIAKLSEQPQFHGRGLIARIMFAMPPSRKGYRDKMRMSTYDDTIAATYEDRIRRMARPLMDNDAPVRTISFSPDALHAFKTMQQDLEDRMRSGGDLEHLAEWATKCQSTIARLAGLLHVIHEHRDDEISADSVEAAIEVGHYWIAHVKIASDLWGSDPLLNGARKIMEWVRAEKISTASVRDVYGFNRRIFPKAADCIPALTLLTERGWMVTNDGEPVSVSRRGIKGQILTFRDNVDENPTESEGLRAMRAMRLKIEKTSSSSSFLKEEVRGQTCAHGAHGAQLDEIEPTDTASAIEADPVDNFDPMNLV
jgi:replicative DNA helicase